MRTYFKFNFFIFTYNVPTSIAKWKIMQNWVNIIFSKRIIQWIIDFHCVSAFHHLVRNAKGRGLWELDHLLTADFSFLSEEREESDHGTSSLVERIVVGSFNETLCLHFVAMSWYFETIPRGLEMYLVNKGGISQNREVPLESNENWGASGSVFARDGQYGEDGKVRMST